MAALWRSLMLLALWTWAGQALAANEKGAFSSAVQALQDGFYERAEAEFNAFTQQYTNSPRLAEAILAQAEARVNLTNYAGAIELLTQKMPQAGKQADGFTFWLGQAYLRKGEVEKAADYFGQVVEKFPESPLRLEAALAQGTAHAKLGNWQRVIDLFQQPGGVFQSAAAATNQPGTLLVRGYLLLSEAYYWRQDYAGAEKALQPIAAVPLPPRTAWERQYLLCRIQAAQGKVDEALRNSTNLLTLATNTTQRIVQAESIGFYAELLERAGRFDEAINTYEKNLGDDFPERQRQALVRLTQIALNHARSVLGLQVLERFCAQHPSSPSLDLALLTVGELRLREHFTTGEPVLQVTTNTPAGTNNLQLAFAALTALVKNHPQSALFGKAQLDLGWCYWRQDQMPEARAALQQAIEHLPASPDKATAHFKLGDTQMRLTQYPAAVTNYSAIISGYADVPEVRTNLFEPALYQMVRAGLAASDLAAATNALAKLLTWYPTGYHTDRAVILTGQNIASEGNPAAARQILLDFVKAAPESSLLPQVQMTIANTYEKEKKWPEVIAVYDNLLARVTNSTVQAQAEYYRAWANFQAGRETNALNLFTNFLARFPTNDRAPLARWWVADYYSRMGRWTDAEVNYQLIFRSTNWARTDISYEAEFAAGRVAVMRQGWRDAMFYFTNLTSNAQCPPEVRAHALSAYGDLLMSIDSTNRVAEYEEAIRVFNTICQDYPTNAIGLLAAGQKANCLLQWGKFQKPPQYEPALLEFAKLTNSPLADFSLRSIARVGIGRVLELQAEQKPPAEQAPLLRLALNQYLDVLYFQKDLREGESPDLLWVQKAGREAARLSEAMQDWSQAIRVYERLAQLLPALKPSLERRAAKASEQLARAKT